MSVSEEVPTQWHPYFESRGFDSFHDVAKDSKVAVSTVIACLRPGGREPKDATVAKVATALRITVEKLRELRGDPVVERFTLPSKADQLDPVERRAVLTVVDALLRAKGTDNADNPPAAVPSTPTGAPPAATPDEVEEDAPGNNRPGSSDHAESGADLGSTVAGIINELDVKHSDERRKKA